MASLEFKPCLPVDIEGKEIAVTIFIIVNISGGCGGVYSSNGLLRQRPALDGVVRLLNHHPAYQDIVVSPGLLVVLHRLRCSDIHAIYRYLLFICPFF